MQRSLLALLLAILGAALASLPTPGNAIHQQAPPSGRQLFAARGEVISKKAASSKGWLQLTVRPPKDYPEVTVMARENDRVGNAIDRARDDDVLGLLGDTDGDDELLTAAEIEEGDFVSVIYDPQAQNRALEMYRH